MNISHTEFINHNVETKGVITLSESILNMKSCIIDKSYGSAISGDAASNIEISSSAIKNGIAGPSTSTLECTN